jgi:hypothetical protein
MGNLTDEAYIDFNGQISLLATLSSIGKARLPEVQNGAYRANRINHEFRKVVKANVSAEQYEKWLKEAKEK